MKNTYKLTLLAALGIATATAAQASDLLIGFNDAAGPASAQNDVVVDVGNLNNFTPTYASGLTPFTPGSASLGAAIASAFGTDGNAMTDVAVGAVGGYTGTGTETLFQTAPNGNLPVWTSANNASWLLAAGEAQQPDKGTYASSGPGAGSGLVGWSQVIAASPTKQGSAVGGNLAGNSANPMALLSSGVFTEQLYESTGSGARGFTPSGWTDVGTLTVNLNTDSITFIGAAVPEPSTYGLLAGAGLLVLSLRRQIVGLKKS